MERDVSKMAKSSTVSGFSATLAAIVAASMIFVAANAASHVGAPGASPQAGAAPAPSPAGVDCMAYLLNLSDCLTYVEKGSNLTKPEKPCCPEVKNLFQKQPICLCELLAHPDQSPIPIDLPKAIGLTSVCKVHVPLGTPASACAALGVPIGSPTSAPAPAPASGAPAPSSGGTPPNNGPSTTASQRHFLVGLAIVLFVSLF